MTTTNKGYVYLASPYSHELAIVRQERYAAAQAASAWLFFKGIFVFSPIAHWHDIAERYIMPTDALSWKRYNDVLQKSAEATYVLGLPGWEKSSGVHGEIELAKQLAQPLLMLWPKGEGFELGTLAE